MDQFAETLRKKIEASKNHTAELENLLVVYEREKDSSSSESIEVTTSSSLKPLEETGVINLDDLDMPTKPAANKDTLLENVKNVIKRFDKKQFTVNHVFAALRQLGKGSDAKHFRNRVSMAVKKLSDEGFLKKFESKGGNQPNKYQEAVKLNFAVSGSNEN